MKALSIRQPWAWLIAAGYKDIENRSWNTKYRGKFLIHASLTLEQFPEIGLQYMDLMVGYAIYCKNNSAIGVIIGEAEIVDVVTDSNSEWFQNIAGNRGFVIQNAKLWDKPVPCKGKLNFFEVPDEVIK